MTVLDTELSLEKGSVVVWRCVRVAGPRTFSGVLARRYENKGPISSSLSFSVNLIWWWDNDAFHYERDLETVGGFFSCGLHTFPFLYLLYLRAL